LEAVLGRLPVKLYEVLRLRAREGLTNRAAAARLGVHPNTASRRYLAGLSWLAAFLNAPEVCPAVRTLDWRESVPDLQPVPLSELRRMPARGGRPRRIPLAVDVEVVRLYCAGLTQQEIADRLNERGVEPVGREWRRSSIRTILRRYGVPVRPSGRRFNPDRANPGVVARPDYPTVMFGEPMCDADALLRRAGVDPSRAVQDLPS
jgi:hypothetical protein